MNIVTIKDCDSYASNGWHADCCAVAAPTRTGHCDETANFVHQSVAGAPGALANSLRNLMVLCVTQWTNRHDVAHGFSVEKDAARWQVLTEL
jgi:hypothetical protein